MAGTAITPLATGAIPAYTGASNVFKSPMVMAAGVILTLLMLRH